MPPGDGTCAIGKTKWRTAMVKFNVGDRVSHAGFGDGVVVEKDDTSVPYLVRFDTSGERLHDNLGRMKTKNYWWCATDNLTPLATFKVGDIVDHASIPRCRGGKITMAHNNNTYSVVWPMPRYSFGEPANALVLVNRKSAPKFTEKKVTVKAGRKYVTNKGRTVGPMLEHNDGFIHMHGDGFMWFDDGKERNKGEHIVAESPNTDHIVILRENGVLKPAHRPFIHADEFAAAKEARRLAELHPGCTFEIWARVGGHRGTVKERTAVEKYTVVEVVE